MDDETTKMTGKTGRQQGPRTMARTTDNQIDFSVPSRQRILERAIEVIDAEGEVAIRTNLIAEECGVTPPVLYRAFGSREGLLVAAQTERYRRAVRSIGTDIQDDIIRAIVESSDQATLRAALDGILDRIFSHDRAVARRVRAEVIGSAVSRPELQRAVVEIDIAFIQAISDALTVTQMQGWIDPKADVFTIVRWALATVNGRVNIEFDPSADDNTSWTTVAKKAILDAFFGCG